MLSPQLRTAVLPPVQWRSSSIVLGVSDRMANEGLLYEGWGAQGMEYLNRTATLQVVAEEQTISRYDAVLVVAQRAKENAYQSVEEETGYLGSSFGGSVGSGMRKPLPAKSQVVAAIEELLEEVEVTGRLPDVVLPTMRQSLGDWVDPADRVEEADVPAELALADAAANLDAPASAAESGPEKLLEDLLTSAAASEELLEEDFDDELIPETPGEDTKGLADLLTSAAASEDLLEEDFDDELIPDTPGEDTKGLADLLGIIGTGGGDNVEASGMSPGDRG